MTKSILIRNVPGDTHLRLKQCAQERGQSLQHYLLEELVWLAERPTMAEAIGRIAGPRLTPVTMESILDDLDEERSNRS